MNTSKSVAVCLLAIIVLFGSLNCLKTPTDSTAAEHNGAKPPVASWIQTYGFDGKALKDIQVVSDSLFIVCGKAKDNSANSDAYVAAINSEGNIIWDQSFGGTGRDDAYCVQIATDMGYIVGGDFEVPSSQAHVQGSDSYDALLLHLDPQGNLLWQQKYDRTDHESIVSIQTTKDGGYFLLATSSDTINSSCWMLRIEGNGDTLWTTILNDSVGLYPQDMCNSYDGGYIIVGHTSMNAAEGAFIMKIDSMGQRMKTGLFSSKYLYSVCPDSHGSYFCAGKVFQGGLDRGLVIKIDDNLSTVWSRVYPLSTQNSSLYSIKIENNGNLISTGIVGELTEPCQLLLSEFGQNGDALCNIVLGDVWCTIGSSLCITPQAGFLVVGRSNVLNGESSALAVLFARPN
jgi:hypothetical protein